MFSNSNSSSIAYFQQEDKLEAKDDKNFVLHKEDYESLKNLFAKIYSVHPHYEVPQLDYRNFLTEFLKTHTVWPEYVGAQEYYVRFLKEVTPEKFANQASIELNNFQFEKLIFILGFAARLGELNKMLECGGSHYVGETEHPEENAKIRAEAQALLLKIFGSDNKAEAIIKLWHQNQYKRAFAFDIAAAKKVVEIPHEKAKLFAEKYLHLNMLFNFSGFRKPNLKTLHCVSHVIAETCEDKEKCYALVKAIYYMHRASLMNEANVNKILQEKSYANLSPLKTLSHESAKEELQQIFDSVYPNSVANLKL